MVEEEDKVFYIYPVVESLRRDAHADHYEIGSSLGQCAIPSRFPTTPSGLSPGRCSGVRVRVGRSGVCNGYVAIPSRTAADLPLGERQIVTREPDWSSGDTTLADAARDAGIARKLLKE